MNRMQKYVTAMSSPSFWPALARGVMPAVEHISALKSLAPKSLIDVGANKGQFALAARHMFPEIEIHAFEPLEAERRKMRDVFGNRVRLYPTALGIVAGEATFFVASRADSSSLLRPGARQEAAYGVTTSRAISVPVARLADVLDISTLPRPILMKLDVQGAELDVLTGAEAILSSIDMIYCEASFVQLYEGQPLASDVTCYLARQGFALRGIFNQSVTRDFGPTQADFLFLRAEKAE
jgi:FkbM family methyltransferase